MLEPPLPRGSSLFVALWLFTLPGFAAEEKAPAANAMTIADTWSLPGILGGGVKSNDAYTDGHFFLTFPAYSSIGTNGSLAGDVIFIEPYSSWGEQGEVAVSLGLGWRHLFSQQSTAAVTHHDGHQAGFFEEGAFIGANLFVDLLDTQFDNRFWQLGFGIEAGTRYLEMRANYYLPLSDRQLALEQHSRQTFTSRSTSTQQEVAYGDLYATGHTISQGALFTTTKTTVTTNTTIDRISRLFEDGMEGWEIEAALLVPGLDRWMDVKILGGYYSYDNQPFGPQAGGTGNVQGWKAGLEVRPVPAVVLNATWYEDERLTGGDWVAGVRFELPFETGDLGDGKGFWGRIGEAFCPRRRHLVERLIEPVRRQNAAVKIAGSVEEEQTVSQVQHVTKVVSQTATQIVLANTVVFVDNAIGNAANPGTYEAPLDTMRNGTDLAGTAFGTAGIVFVQGRPVSYNERLNITRGVRLIGSSPGFQGFGGKAFQGRTQDKPLVNGGFDALNIPGLVEINGFNISTLVGNPAVNFRNVSQGIIANNVLQVSTVSTLFGTSLIEVETTGTTVSRIVVANNQTLDDNSVEPLTSGLTMLVRDSSRLTAVIEGNAFGRASVGVNLFTEGNTRSDFTLTGNTIHKSAHDGLTVLAQQNANTTLILSGNDITFNSEHSSGISYIPQISARVFHSAIIHFDSTGVLNNTVLKLSGDTDPLYHIETSGGAVTGSILINGILHPANVDLP